MIGSLSACIQRTTATSVLPNPSVNADPLRRPCLPARPPLVIIGRTGKPVRLRSRRYLER
jgi:hypothetical protein